MDGLAQFLRDQLDEDERVARAATQGDWVWSREFVTPPGYHHRTVGPLEPGDAAFIAAHNPARVLREIDAKRQILDRYEELRAASKEDGLIGDVTEEYQDFLLRVLAAVYADRPGYREEWRP